MEASQLTPLQIKYRDEFRARRARIAAAAKPDKPLVCLSASARAKMEAAPKVELPPEPAPVETWAERQIRLYQPWFTVEEIEPGITIRPQVATVMQVCSRFFDISMNDIKSIRRHGPVVRCRQIAMFLTKEFTLRTLPEIGRAFGNRDHTTVIHAVRKIERKAAEDPELAAELDVLRRRIREAL